MEIRRLTEKNLDQVSIVHSLAFPDSVLTKLGHEAVRRYYLWQMVGPHELYASGAFEGDLLGFCFGGIFQGALSGFLYKNRWFLVRCLAVRPWLILSEPLFRDRIATSMNLLRRYSPQASTSLHKPETSDKSSFGILSIAVDPKLHRSGIGNMLIRNAEEFARQKSFKMMHLTVNPGNTAAISFYEYNGWEKAFENGVWSGRMRKSL